MEKKSKTKDEKNGTLDTEEKPKSKKDFLVVGLGASAGGVKALQEFFASMPPNSGMAFVAILHLSPEHESKLPEILQAHTSMKVMQVTQTVKVEPNNVYVIPPNKQLEMVDGVIRPAVAERPAGHRIAIDVFFRTLAEAYEKNAVCVVLSGTGSDGTLGLKRVKESNGFAIVQDPDDAEYDSMPRSAINTQLVDWVLPVHKMPEKLIHFRESSERLHLTNGAEAKETAKEIHADESLREVLTILRVRTGHDFSNYKTPTLIRRIARHLQIHELEDIPSYLELLRNHPNEVQSLLKNLLINVTNFFRDKEAFAALEKEVVPNIFAGKTSRDTVRVWSAGCASGEEAYSLAMLLQEFADTLTDPPKFQIFASDVDDEAIAEAREHRYPESIEADVPPNRLKRFFVKEGSFYRIKKELRETILFAPHNVLRDPPFSRLDLITCRNLLIYLNRETQDKVLQIFHFALASSGYLFLGSSETAESVATLYAPVDKKQRIYSRRAASVMQAAMPVMPVVGPWEVRLPDRKTGNPRERVTSLGEIHYKLLENYAPSSVLVNQDFDIVYSSGAAGKFLRFPGGEPSRNLLKAINPDLLPDLRAALFNAQREHKSSEFPNVRVRFDGGEETVINLIVRAVDVSDEASDFLLVIFEERLSPSFLKTAAEEIAKIPNKDEATETVIRRLEEDLQRTKEHLRFTIEQHETALEEHKASNEELQAINEELRSASEELETSKEELQLVNEELTTVNHELKDKIDETIRANSDLQNLMQSTDIATIFLDKNLKIKRYAPLIEKLFNITPTDIGRPLEHFTHTLNYENLVVEAEQVLRTLKTVERKITDRDGHYFLTRISPYRTTEDRIEGVVLNFIDVTEVQVAGKALAESEQMFRALTEATAEIIYKMNADWTKMRSLAGKEFIATTINSRGDWMDEYIPETDKAQVWTAISEAIIAKKNFELEHRVYKLDGSIGWTFSRAVPILNEQGEIVEWFGAASDITDRKRREADLAFLAEVSQDLERLTDIDETMNALGAKIGAHLGLSACIFGEIIGKDEAQITEITHGWNRADVPNLLGTYQMSEFMTLEMIHMCRASENIVIRDVFADPKTDGNQFASINVGSFVGVPFVRDGDWRFLLVVYRSEPYDWSENEIALVRELMTRIWARLERARAEESVAADLRDTQILQELAARLVSEENSQTIYDEIMTAALGITRSDAGTVQIYDAENKELVLLATSGFGREVTDYFQRVNASSKTGCGIALESGERTFIDYDPHDTDKESRLHVEAGYLSAQSTPLVARSGAAIGMLSTHWRAANHRPTERELRFLDLLRRQAADLIEQRQNEKTIHESEAKYRALFDSIDEGFCIFELQFDDRGNAVDWIYREANPAFEGQTGFVNAVGKRISQLQPDLERSWFEQFAEVARTGEPIRFIQFTEAMHRWYDVYAFRVGEAGDNRVSLLFNDISKRKRIEEALRESEERLRIAVEAAEMATWDWDLVKNEVVWNERHFLLFGMKPSNEPLDPAAFFDHVHPDDQDCVSKRLQQAIETNSTYTAEFRIVCENGKTRWMEGYGHVVENLDGKPTRMSGVMSDITNRKRAEDAVRQSEERLQLIMKSITDYAIITSNPDGIINGWNTGAENTFGWTAKEAVGQPCELIYTPEDRAAGIAKLEMRLALENGIAEDTRWHIRKDGSRFFASGTVAPIQDGEFDGFVKITSDQTARMEAEKTVQEKETLRRIVVGQEDERRRIARDIHDHFGQQLTALRMSLDALRKDNQNKKLGGEIEKAQEIAAKLDADVDFIAWELRPVALEDLGLLTALNNFVRDWAHHTKIETEFHTTGLSKINLSFETETNLYRIAQEALNNIYKHAAATKVSVLLERRRDRIVLIVEDNGKGFDAQDKANRQKGIGLSGMKERAGILGGDFEIESEKGKGTTVYARVPLAKNAEKE